MREEIDTLWQKALYESVVAGETYTRYHFAALIAAPYEQDAKRYRWLRNGGDDDIGVGIYDPVVGDFCFTTWDSELDEAIDQAMQETK